MGEPCPRRACPQPRTVPGGGRTGPWGTERLKGPLMETRQPGTCFTAPRGFHPVGPGAERGHSAHSAAPTLLPPGVLGAGAQTPRL